MMVPRHSIIMVLYIMLGYQPIHSLQILCDKDVSKCLINVDSLVSDCVSGYDESAESFADFGLIRPNVNGTFEIIMSFL